MAPNRHRADVEHSDDEEDSSLDISTFVAALGKVETPNPRDSSESDKPGIGRSDPRPQEASRKEGHSQGSLRPDEKPPTEGWSSSSAPVPGSNANNTSSPGNARQDPAGTVSWRDIEQYSLKLDADGSGVRIERIDLSCMEEEDLTSLALSPNTLAQLKALGSADSRAASPTEHTRPTALAYPPSYPQALTRVSMTSTPPPLLPPMLPTGGDIVRAAAKPMPFCNPPAYPPTPAKAALVSQASGRWPAQTQRQKAEIQPVPRQTTPTKQIPGWRNGAVAKEAQRDLDDAFHELNSGSTRSSSMVVPGAAAMRSAAAKPAGTKGFLGSIKSKCGDLFSSSKRSKGRC